MSWYSDNFQKRRTIHSRRILTPGEMKARQEKENAEIRQWAESRKLGTRPQTFPETAR